jgi:hypothetical protein
MFQRAAPILRSPARLIKAARESACAYPLLPRSSRLRLHEKSCPAQADSSSLALVVVLGAINHLFRRINQGPLVRQLGQRQNLGRGQRLAFFLHLPDRRTRHTPLEQRQQSPQITRHIGLGSPIQEGHAVLQQMQAQVGQDLRDSDDKGLVKVASPACRRLRSGRVCRSPS